MGIINYSLTAARASLITLPMSLRLNHLFSVFVFSLFALPAAATPVFIEGVSETSGWYDVNKKRKWNYTSKPTEYYTSQDLPFDDSNMCWAAAAANTLQWWQDRYGNIPEGTPNGYAATASVNGLQYVCQLQIYQNICKNWTNGGSHVEQAWNWWFNGDTLHETLFPGSTQLTGSQGGYWQSLNRTCTLYGNASYDTSALCNTYAFWNDPAQTEQFKSIIKSYLDNNYGTALSLSGEGGHAITLWGYEETEEHGLVLYLTDSDDYSYELFKQAVIVNDEGYLCLGSLDGAPEKYAQWDSATGTGLYIAEIQGLTVPIPEPAAFGLLAGLLALAPLTRRRRN